MLKTRIIPCLDVKNGRVVKGINFVDLKMLATQLNKQAFMIKAEQTKYAS